MTSTTRSIPSQAILLSRLASGVLSFFDLPACLVILAFTSPPSLCVGPWSKCVCFKWEPLKINQNLNHICPFSHEKIGHVRVTRRSCFCFCSSCPTVIRSGSRTLDRHACLWCRRRSLTWLVINDDKSCVRSISFFPCSTRPLSSYLIPSSTSPPPDRWLAVSHLYCCVARQSRGQDEVH